jgi:hypothetical protein
MKQLKFAFLIVVQSILLGSASGVLWSCLVVVYMSFPVTISEVGSVLAWVLSLSFVGGLIGSIIGIFPGIALGILSVLGFGAMPTTKTYRLVMALCGLTVAFVGASIILKPQEPSISGSAMPLMLPNEWFIGPVVFSIPISQRLASWYIRAQSAQ